MGDLGLGVMPRDGGVGRQFVIGMAVIYEFVLTVRAS